MNERLKFEGRLSAARRDLKSFELRIKSQRTAIREMLDPFENLADIPGDQVAAAAMELAQKLIKYKELQGRIREINRALGRE